MSNKIQVLKAYHVQGDEYGVIRFAKSNVAARREGANELEEEFNCVSCKRIPGADKYAELGYVPSRDLVEEFGFWQECAYCSCHVDNETEDRVWEGDGLPPVGILCEIASSTPYLNIGHPEGAVVKIYAHFTDDRGIELAAFVDAFGKVGGVCTSKCFRPIRSEADKKKEKVVDEIMSWMHCAGRAEVELIYDAIKSGKIVID